jgi:hypothetical protein
LPPPFAEKESITDTIFSKFRPGFKGGGDPAPNPRHDLSNGSSHVETNASLTSSATPNGRPEEDAKA